MALDLQKKYYELLNPVKQGLSQIGKQGKVNSIGQSKVNILQKAQIPQPIKKAFNKNVQNIANTNLIELGTRLNPSTAYLSSFAKPPSAPTAGQYAKGQIIKPLKTALNSKASLADRGLGAFQAGMSLTGSGTVWNLGTGQASGLAQGIRTKKNPIKLAKQATANPTSFANQGLGIKNPIVAMGVDIFAGNPKSALKGITKVRGIGKGFKPQNMHREDLDAAKNALENLSLNKHDIKYMTTQGLEDANTIKYLAEKYIGKDFVKKNPKVEDQAQEVLNWIRVQQRQPQISMGIKGNAKSFGMSSKSNLVPEVSSLSQEIPQIQRQPQHITNIPDVRVSPKTLGPSISQGSVLDEVKKGFKSGRDARVSRENQIKGGISQRTRTQLIDKLSPVFDFTPKDLSAEANPYKRMRLLAGVSGKVDSYIEKNVAPIIKANKDRTDDLSALWALEREKELVTTKGLTRRRTAQQIDQGIEELRAKYGDEGLASLQASTQQLRKTGDDLLLMLNQSGVIDDASLASIRQNNKFYAPMEAVEHMADNLEKGRGVGSFNVASQDAIKKISSYEGEVGDPTEAFLRKIPKIIALAEKNKAMQSLSNLRVTHPEIYGDLIKPLKTVKAPVSAVSPKGKKFTRLQKVRETAPPGMGVINVFENGENVSYAVPEAVESAIKNLDAESSNILTRIGGIQGNILRTGATGLNMAFIPVNIIRDVQDSLTTVLTEKGARAAMQFLASYPKAIFSAARKDNLYQEWLNSGGAASTMTEEIFKNTPKTISALSGQGKTKNEIVRQFIESPKDLIKFAGRVAEQSTRIARYKTGIEKLGESALEAGFQSRDISIDFAKNGNSIKTLNQAIPFLNASIQGTEKLARLYKNNPKQAIAATGILYGVPTILLYSHNSKFNDYNDIPSSEKQNNWIILARDRTPEEIAAGEKVKGMKFPKGFLGRIVSNTIESSLDFIDKRDPSAFGEYALDTAAGLSPIGLPVNKERLGQTLSTILPPVVKAGVEATSNTNLYFGSDIVPRGLQNLPAREQYRENTPGIYKFVGNKTGISPLILENTVNTTTGGVGRQVAEVFSGNLKGGTVDQITRRFAGIQGGVNADKAWKVVDKEKEYTALRNKQLKEAYSRGDMKEVERLSEGMTSQQLNTLISNLEKKNAQGDISSEQKAYQSLTKEEQARVLKDRPELKSELDLMSAEAAGKSPVKVSETVVKTRVEKSGKPEIYKNKYYYVNDNGNPASIDMDFKIKTPKLTGMSELDKKLKSSYQSEITTKSNNIVKLFEMGAISQEKAEKLLSELKGKRSSGRKSSGGARKGRKVKAIKFSLPKAQRIKIIQPKIRKIKPRKIRKISLSTNVPKKLKRV